MRSVSSDAMPKALRSFSTSGSQGQPNRPLSQDAPIQVCSTGLAEPTPPEVVTKMFQPPCAGGSRLARRDTTEPQSIDCTSTLSPAWRIASINTCVAGVMVLWSVAANTVIGSPL